MAESRNYFHGYSRSKDFISTLQSCFEAATCPTRPWTIKDSGVGCTVPEMDIVQYRRYIQSHAKPSPFFVVSHEDIDGETENILFYDCYKVGAEETYGLVRALYFPNDMCDATNPDFNCSSNVPIYTYQDIKFHNEDDIEDLPWLPQHVWYWVWIDDNCCFIRVQGNVGGEGSATSVKSWYYSGDAQLRGDDDGQIPFKETAAIMGTRSSFVKGNELGAFINSPFGPAFWYGPSRSAYSYGNMVGSTGDIDFLMPPTLNPDLTQRLTVPENGTATSYTATFDTTSTGFYNMYVANNPHVFGYTFNTPTIVDQFYIDFDAYQYQTGICAWEIHGSNDGTNWDLLHEMEAAPSTIKGYFEFYNITPYTHYEFRYIADSVSTYVRVRPYKLTFGNINNKAVIHHISKAVLSAKAKYFPSLREYTEYPWRLENGQLMVCAEADDILLESDLITHPDSANTYSFHTPENLLMKKIEGPVGATISYSGGDATINWTNPSKAAGIKVVRSESMFYMKKSEDGVTMMNDSSPDLGDPASFVDSSVVSGHTYNYAIIAYDSEGNESTPHENSLVQITIP